MSCEDCDCGGCDMFGDVVIQSSKEEVLQKELDDLKAKYGELQVKFAEMQAALRMVSAVEMLKEIKEELVHCPECTIMSGKCNCELEDPTVD